MDGQGTRGELMTPDPQWSWIDSFFGAVLGAVAGLLSLLGWTHRQVNTLHARINATNQTVGQHATDIATLEAHHEANLQFQERVDRALYDLSVKNDEQLKILMELRGRSFNSHNGGGQ